MLEGNLEKTCRIRHTQLATQQLWQQGVAKRGASEGEVEKRQVEM